MADKEELKIKICINCFIVCEVTEQKCPYCGGLAFDESSDDEDCVCSDDCGDCGCCDCGDL